LLARAHFTLAGFDVLNDTQKSLPSRFASVEKIVARGGVSHVMPLLWI